MNWIRYPVWRRLVLGVLLAALSACSYLPKTTGQMPANWSQTVAQRQQLVLWKLSGRLGIQTENNGGSLDLFWNQQGEDYQIRLIAALGQGTILIRGDADGVMLKTREGETYAQSADELLAASVGVNLPLSGLHAWLRGVPAADRAVQKQRWDEDGQLHKLVQDGWSVEMSQYRKVGAQLLPHAFYLERKDQPELEIRLLIQQWNLPDREIL